MAQGRPPVIAPGTALSKWYEVESLVRLAEGRMFYLAREQVDENGFRRCWHCGSEESPREAGSCVSCALPFRDGERFLVAVRWNRDGFEPYTRYHRRGISHPGVLCPDDVFLHEGVLCSVVRYRDEALLIDEGAPLGVELLLHLAQRFAGLLAFLHHQGVALDHLGQVNFVHRPEDDRFFLFDPDIATLFDGPVPAGRGSREIQDLAAMLRRFTPVNADPLRAFFEEAEGGAYEGPMEFGRAVEKLFSTLDRVPAPRGVAAMTDVGLTRTLNEDNWGWTELAPGVHLYVVADGMGGHDSGEVASRVAVDTILREARRRASEQPELRVEALENLLEEAFQEANNLVKSMAEQRRNDMGTTLVTLLCKGRTGLVANVGDSRAYLLRDGILHQVSRDHSLVARMVEDQRITAEEARNHPHSNILLRTVGTERNVDIDIFKIEMEPGDRMLLCSDGLWGEVEDQEMEAILNHYEDPRVCARELLRAAHHAGAHDNVTILIVGIPEDEA